MDSSTPETKLEFPRGFLLGAGESSYQIEGDNINSDWWQAEQEGKLPKSGQATDHYHRYEEDYKLAKQIGLNAIRTSFEWSRIEPIEGQWNAEAIEHYKKVLRSMKEQGLTRMVTLWHWSVPQWFLEKGGFENKEGVEAFARYAWFVAQNLGKDVDIWLTMNEPELYVNGGYRQGHKPPFKKSLLLTRRVMENLILAHKAAYKAIKQALGNVPIGVAKHNHYFVPFRKYNLADRLTTFAANEISNKYFLEKIQNQLDFIGLNYYYYDKMKFNWKHGYEEMNDNQNFLKNNPNATLGPDRSDMGWSLFPKGIYYILEDLKQYKKPIYITECGLADAADTLRPKYIREVLHWVREALKDGSDIKGFFYWSLTDNYEWQNGFGPRFGLIEINYETQERKIRPSASIFKEIKIT